MRCTILDNFSAKLPKLLVIETVYEVVGMILVPGDIREGILGW